MTDSSSKAVRVGIEGVFYSLAHVPDLVRYGSKPSRELRANTTLEPQLKNQLRSFSAATAYAPHQVYIGNVTPAELSNLPKPWYDKLIEGATIYRCINNATYMSFIRSQITLHLFGILLDAAKR